MLCDRCHDRPAVVNLETISGAVVTSTHLCDACASQGAWIAAGSAGAPSVGTSERGPIPPDVLVAIAAEVEARSDPTEIAHLLARIEHYQREHPTATVPPELIAFRARHAQRDH